MKRSICIAVLLMLFVGMFSAGFAGEIGYKTQNIPMASNQHVLFTLDEAPFSAPSEIHDLGYDKVNEHLYILLDHQLYQQEVQMDRDDINETNQIVYSLPEKEETSEPEYPTVQGFERRGIEFESNQTWAMEVPYLIDQVDEEKVWFNNFQDDLKSPTESFLAKGFAVQEDQVLYYLRGCIDDDNFYVGSLDTMGVDMENPINGDLEYMKGYDLSADGKEILYIGTEFGEREDSYVRNYVVRVERETGLEIDRFMVSNYEGETFAESYDLYTTENYIVVLHKNSVLGRGFIERYTYEGQRIDGVETNFCVRRITEGPSGSTLYIQKRYSENEMENDTLEVVQIDWKGPSDSRNGGMRPVVQERTRDGLTMARFQDSQFGLLRAEEPETGIVDYRAPIRSEENLVRLQMPYYDVAAKLASGARNLVVEYRDQMITLPLTIFDCEDLLDTMPCQDEATFEIILKTDEAGNVSYQVQLFVVEKMNGMTSVVHRKTVE